MRFGRGRKPEICYQMWTGCPSCGFQPQGDTVDDPECLRVGVTNGIGSRMKTGYEKSHPDMIQHVAVMVLEHWAPGTSRDTNLNYESGLINAWRPMFNDRGNDSFAEQAAARARLLGEPVPFLTMVDVGRLKARRIARSVAGLAVAAGMGAAAFGVVLTQI